MKTFKPATCVTLANLPALPYSFDPIREDVIFVLAVSGIHKLTIRRWYRFSILKNRPSTVRPQTLNFITRSRAKIKAEKLKSVHTISIVIRQKDGTYSIRNTKS